QGNARIPADQVAINAGAINLRFNMVSARFEGRLQDGRIVGTFTQGRAFPLVFTQGEAPPAPPPAPPPPPLTQDLLRALRTQSGAPALAAAAAKQGGRRIAFVDGLRAATSATPATTHDQWHLGSITKSMTATLVARCVEAGAVSWDDTIGGVLGAAIPDMRADYRDASFRHLLCHRAGLVGDIPLDQFVRFARENAD